MGNMDENRVQCPWCDAELHTVEEKHQGSHGKMRVLRCSQCSKLISARLEGEPDRILRKELISGGQQ